MALFTANGLEIPFPQREFSFKEDQPLRVQVVTRGQDEEPRKPPEVKMLGSKAWSSEAAPRA